MFKEFKAFMKRGNVLDLAIGIIIGGAFGKIVSSLVNDIIMPPIGFIIGNVDFANLFISLNGESYPSLAVAKAAGAPTLNIGVFLNNVIDFVIIALVIFLIVRQINHFKEKSEIPAVTAAPTTKECPFCATQIPIKAVRCPHCTSELKK